MTLDRIEFRFGRRPADVFRVLADLERAPEWVPGVVSVVPVAGNPPGIGARYRVTASQMGQTETVEVVVTEFEPGRAVAHEGSVGSACFQARFELRAEENATLAVHEYGYELSGMARLVAPMVGRLVRQNAETACANLDKLLRDSA